MLLRTNILIFLKNLACHGFAPFLPQTGSWRERFHNIYRPVLHNVLRTLYNQLIIYHVIILWVQSADYGL